MPSSRLLKQAQQALKAIVVKRRLMARPGGCVVEERSLIARSCPIDRTGYGRNMSELEAVFATVVAAARDWATLLFAVLAASYAWMVDRDLKRDRAVLIDGYAWPVSGKTLRVEIDIRNRSRRPIKVTKLDILRPRPSVVAMEGVHEPGAGPIHCRHLVPAESRGALAFLLGSPDLAGPISVRCSFTPHPGRLALPRRRTAVIDPTLPTVGQGQIFGKAASETTDENGRLAAGSVDDGVGRDQ